jgi:hypothetical protein
MDEASDEQHRQTWQSLFELARQTRKSVEELRGEGSDSHGPASGPSSDPGAALTIEASRPSRTGSEDPTSLTKRRENLMALEKQCEGWIKEEVGKEEERDCDDASPPLHECILQWIRKLREITEEQLVMLLEQEQEEEDCQDMLDPGSNASSQHNGPEPRLSPSDGSDPDNESDGSDESVRSSDADGFDGSDDSNDSDGSSNSEDSEGAVGPVILTPSSHSIHSEADSSSPLPPSYSLVDKARDIRWFERKYMEMLERVHDLKAVGYFRPEKIPRVDQAWRELERQYMLILETLWQVPNHEDDPIQETDSIFESTLASRQQRPVADDDLADREMIIRSKEYYKEVMERFRQEKGRKMGGRRYQRFKSYRLVINGWWER